MTTDNVAPPVLNDQLCADLVAASRAIVAAYDTTLSTIGLNYHQYLALLVLWEEDRAIAMRSVAERLNIKVDDLHTTVRQLVVAGWATRQVDRDDAGASLIEATGAAERLKGPVCAIHCDIKQRLAMGTDEFRDLQRRLREVTTLMRDSRSNS